MLLPWYTHSSGVQVFCPFYPYSKHVSRKALPEPRPNDAMLPVELNRTELANRRVSGVKAFFLMAVRQGSMSVSSSHCWPGSSCPSGWPGQLIGGDLIPFFVCSLSDAGPGLSVGCPFPDTSQRTSSIWLGCLGNLASKLSHGPRCFWSPYRGFDCKRQL